MVTRYGDYPIMYRQTLPVLDHDTLICLYILKLKHHVVEIAMQLSQDN